MRVASGTTRVSNISTILKFRPRKLYWSAAISFLALIGRAPAVQAANFNFTYAPGTSLEQMLGFEMAGMYWSNYLDDDVTINLFIETTDQLPENVIGGALPGLEAEYKFENFYKKNAYLQSLDFGQFEVFPSKVSPP